MTRIIVYPSGTESITATVIWCDCGWRGTIAGTESGDEGELICPDCYEEISVVVGESDLA